MFEGKLKSHEYKEKINLNYFKKKKKIICSAIPFFPFKMRKIKYFILFLYTYIKKNYIDTSLNIYIPISHQM